MSLWKKFHPGGGGETNAGKPQKRIDPAEQQRAANNPKPKPLSKQDAKRHPGA